MSYICTFDGHDLTSLLAIDFDMVRRLPAWEPSLVEVPGRSGAIFGGTRATPVEITMPVYAVASTRDQRQEDLRTLAGWLAVDQPKMLKLGDEGGRYRLAMPRGEIEIEPYLNGDGLEITFICPDPRLYGGSSSKTVNRNSITSIIVGGTAPADVYISGTVYVNAGYVQIYDSSTQSSLKISCSNGSRVVSIDCAARSASIDGVITILDPSCDWWELAPGEHSFQLSGISSGSLTLQWTEMWW